MSFHHHHHHHHHRRRHHNLPHSANGEYFIIIIILFKCRLYRFPTMYICIENVGVSDGRNGIKKRKKGNKKKKYEMG